MPLPKVYIQSSFFPNRSDGPKIWNAIADDRTVITSFISEDDDETGLKGVKLNDENLYLYEIQFGNDCEEGVQFEYEIVNEGEMSTPMQEQMEEVISEAESEED
jgi:hypothetical protein